MLRLTMRRGPTPGAVYDLEADEITIGRGSKNSIIIRDNEVSRDHCRLIRITNDYELQDLSSSNGTFVNGQRVAAPWLLQPGTLIELGDTITLEYGLPVSEVEPPAPTPSADVRYSLVMIKGPKAGEIFPLNLETTTIGRDLNNTIIIPDPEVSRHHLRLTLTARRCEIEDLATTNGTFINGERLHGKRRLDTHDSIRLGTMVQLRFLRREDALDEEIDETSRRTISLISAPVDTTVSALEPVNVDLHPTIRSTGLMPGSLRDQIMIVYAREDWGTVVAPLLVRLQDTHLNAWVDQYLPLHGENWHRAVEQALDECWLMIVVVSAGALHADHVKPMYQQFLAMGKPVIPLLLGTETLPSELTRLRTLLYDAENHQRSFHKLVFEIMQLRQQMIGSPSPPLSL